MILYLFKYLSFCSIISLLLFSIGEMLRHLLKLNFINFYKQIFFNLFSGTLVFITLVALYFTNGRTIFLCNLLILIFVYFYFRNKPIQTEIYSRILYNPNVLFKFFLESTLIFFLYFVFKYLTATNILGFPFWFDSDNISYSKNIWYIINSGNETSVFDYFDLSKRNPSPFHYYDLWFAGGVAKVFNLNYLHSLQLITHPIGFFTIIIGTIAIVEQKVYKINMYHKLLCIGILFFCGLFINAYTQYDILKQYGFMYLLNVFKFPKGIISYSFILASLYLYFNRKVYLAMLVLLGLIIAQIATAPTLLTSLVVYFFGVWIITKNVKYLRYLIPIISVLFFIVLFYTTLKVGKTENLYSQYFTKEYINSLLTIKQLFTLIKLSIGDGFLGLLFIHLTNVLLLGLILTLNFN